ncbi:LPXTG cell wall anchor domain-containing protein, partial [Candidatus Saccharibacteria bacterium]|nr:LPXTG cell wall anchor domain-containing protein [Candidatus Saccharibacteria bacterium]
TPPAPTTPSVIAQTGTSDNTIAAILGLGTLAGALTAYIRSRKYANR